MIQTARDITPMVDESHRISLPPAAKYYHLIYPLHKRLIFSEEGLFAVYLKAATDRTSEAPCADTLFPCFPT